MNRGAGWEGATAREALLARTYQEEMVERLSHALPEDGLGEPIRGLFIRRYSSPIGPIHSVLAPSFCLIAQGCKLIAVGEELYRHEPTRYLLATVGLPIVGKVLAASREQPFLALRLELDPALVASVMVEAGHLAFRSNTEARAIGLSTLHAELLDATLRLVRLIGAGAEARVLAPLIRREIIFRLLTGEHGRQLQHLAGLGGGPNSIASAVERIRSCYDRTLRMDDLAGDLGMSVSAFHHHFKAVTAMTPVQFQKQLRLQEARRLMLAESMDAASAGFRVGYSDASHFNRDYKKLYGTSPGRDVAQLRAELGTVPATFK